MNRLIAVHEIHPDITLSKKFHYDLCGNLVAKVDAMGNETRFSYDAFNRPITVDADSIPDEAGQLHRPITRYEYDEMSHLKKIITPEGYVTEFAYTIRGKPCKIRYPDGSEEHFEYDLEGRLVKEIQKNGLAII